MNLKNYTTSENEVQKTCYTISTILGYIIIKKK